MAGFDGLTIVRASLLPPGTMYVSDDVYALLTETSEQRQSRTKSELEKVAAMIKKMRENPRGTD